MNGFKPKKQKLCLSEGMSAYWEISLYANREIWRNIPFGKQDEIMKMINSLQCTLESACAGSCEKLSFDYEVKISNERQANSEKSEPAKQTAEG